MEEESKVTPESEKIDSKAEATTAEKVEKDESGDAELAELLPREVKQEKTQDTVPLSVFLAQKEDLKELKKEIKALAESKTKVTVEGLGDLASKYPDVSQDFINDLLTAATEKARKEALTEVESKYNPILEKQRYREEQEKFDKAFDKVFNRAVEENKELPENIDKELIKTLVQTPKYRNVKVADILTQVYGSVRQEKSSSENDTTAAASEIETISSFENITEEQRKVIMSDEKARKEYFNWLDKQPNR